MSITPKLYIFVAEQVPVAVVIRKEKKRGGKVKNYQMIHWDMTTNEFTEGQWLLNKQLYTNGCAISPNGELFGWVYNKYWVNDGQNTFAGVSCIPNFTAELFGEGVGRHYDVRFDEDSNPLPSIFNFEQRGSRIIPFSEKQERPSGLQPQTFNTYKGDVVTVDGYKIILNGAIIYNAETNHFASLKPVIK